MQTEKDAMVGQSAVPNSIPLEYPNCPVCESNCRTDVLQFREPYRLAQCSNCGVYYLFPRPVEATMQEVYGDVSYFEGGSHGYANSSYVAQEIALRATFRRLLHNMGKAGLTGGKLLEIGCGYGFLLDEAKPLFDYRAGTELSAQAAEKARESGATVFVGGVDEIAEDAKFDCVIATQVIEHVYHPVMFLRKIAGHLRSGGHILLATPDIGGVLHKLMGRRWPSFKVPEHVVYYDWNTLPSVMRAAGVNEIRRFPYPHAFPLSLIASKFGVSVKGWLGRTRIWVPATSVAAYGSVKHD